jgi:hypothetical protein
MIWARLYQRSISLFALCVLAIAAFLPTAWSLWQTDAMPWAQEICSSSVTASNTGTDDPSAPTSDHSAPHSCAAGWIVTGTPLFAALPIALTQPTRALTATVPAIVFWHVHSRAPPRLTQ